MLLFDDFSIIDALSSTCVPEQVEAASAPTSLNRDQCVVEQAIGDVLKPAEGKIRMRRHSPRPGRARAYVGYRVESDFRLQGRE